MFIEHNLSSLFDILLFQYGYCTSWPFLDLQNKISYCPSVSSSLLLVNYWEEMWDISFHLFKWGNTLTWEL